METEIKELDRQVADWKVFYGFKKLRIMPSNFIAK